VIGPFVSGPIYTALGPSAPFLAGACVTVFAVLFIRLAQSRSAIALEQG
jgi:hypothetical protein